MTLALASTDCTGLKPRRPSRLLNSGVAPLAVAPKGVGEHRHEAGP
jgi:hypothetical protein